MLLLLCLVQFPEFFLLWQHLLQHLIFKFKEKPQQTTLSITSTKFKHKNEEARVIDNVDYFADMRRKFGDLLPDNAIPHEMIEKLKSQGRW